MVVFLSIRWKNKLKRYGKGGTIAHIHESRARYGINFIHFPIYEKAKSVAKDFVLTTFGNLEIYDKF